MMGFPLNSLPVGRTDGQTAERLEPAAHWLIVGRGRGGRRTGVNTVEPIDGRLGGGRVVKRHGGLSFGLPGVPVGEQVDHGLTRLLVHLRGDKDSETLLEEEEDEDDG